MAMLKLTLAITKVAIKAKMAILAISSLAKGVINMAVWYVGPYYLPLLYTPHTVHCIS